MNLITELEWMDVRARMKAVMVQKSWRVNVHICPEGIWHIKEEFLRLQNW